MKAYLISLPDDRKKVVFIDEMPWFDTQRSNFVRALEYFWNSWAASQYNIVLVATGSATSWMTDKLLKNRGGLHNRMEYCTALIDLTCDDNQLNALDVSKNTALAYLYCDKNQLTTLDVSKTNLGWETAELDCAGMPTLQTLYLKTGWKIRLNGQKETCGRG